MNNSKFPQMDWGQVVLNGGPPCFHVEGPQYCGRAERWPGHGNPAFHAFVSLADAITTALDEREREVRAGERERGARIAEKHFCMVEPEVECKCQLVIATAIRTPSRQVKREDVIAAAIRHSTTQEGS